MSGGSRKRKLTTPSHRPNNRDNEKPPLYDVVKSFHESLTSPEVTVIDHDSGDPGSTRRVQDQDKPSVESKSLKHFTIPKKNRNIDLTRDSMENPPSSQTSRVMSSQQSLTALPPVSNVFSIMNKASETLTSTSSISKQRTSQRKPITQNKQTHPKLSFSSGGMSMLRNSMESSLPPPPKKSTRMSSRSSESGRQSSVSSESKPSEMPTWDDTCLGLVEPCASFSPSPRTPRTTAACVQNIRNARKPSVSPDKDDERASNVSNTSSESLPCYTKFVGRYRELGSDKQASESVQANKSVYNDEEVLTIDSQSDDDEPIPESKQSECSSQSFTHKTDNVEHTASPKRSPLFFPPPKLSAHKSGTDAAAAFNLISKTHQVISIAKNHSASKNQFSRSELVSNQISVTPKSSSQTTIRPTAPHKRSSTAADILSIIDKSDSPTLSKEEFSFETPQCTRTTTRSKSHTIQKDVLPQNLTRGPIRSSQSREAGHFYETTNPSSNNDEFKRFSSATNHFKWISTRSSAQGPPRSAPSQLLSDCGVSKSLKLRETGFASRFSKVVDEDEGFPLSVHSVQIGRLQPSRVLHVEVNSDALCLKLDCDGITESVRVFLNKCYAWQMHFGDEPYLICIIMKQADGKAIAKKLTTKYHLDSDFYNPKSEEISERYIVLTLETPPSSQEISSISKYLKEAEAAIDENLSTEEAKELVKKAIPLKPSRSRGEPLSRTTVKGLVSTSGKSPTVAVRRSLRSRKPPVRTNPSSPITLEDPSPAIRNRPNVKLLTYNVPAGSRVNIELSTQDVDTLSPGEFLNDKVVDFYLRYMWYEKLNVSLRGKVHIFSSFFHTRLKDASRDNKEHKELNTPERIHNRVRTWTRRVDLFDKEWVILPVCDRAHWFVAFVYKAGEFDPDKELALRITSPKKPRKKSAMKKKKSIKNPMVIKSLSTDEGEATETEEPLSQPMEVDPIVPGAQLLSAAEGSEVEKCQDFILVPYGTSEDESTPNVVSSESVAEAHMDTVDTETTEKTLNSDLQECVEHDILKKQDSETVTVNEGHNISSSAESIDESVVRVEDSLEDQSQDDESEQESVSKAVSMEGKSLVENIRPCVLVLDSLGVRRTGIVRTIRNYLTVEWKEKKVSDSGKELSFELLPARYPTIPLQNNSSDCGVFMLQYVESLLMRMVEGQSYPDTADGWGSYEKTGNKREEIKTLIMTLSKAQSNNSNQSTSKPEC